jgi:hypothetical protein
MIVRLDELDIPPGGISTEALAAHHEQPLAPVTV